MLALGLGLGLGFALRCVRVGVRVRVCVKVRVVVRVFCGYVVNDISLTTFLMRFEFQFNLKILCH